MASYDQEISQAITRIAFAGDGAVLGLGLAVVAVRTWFKFYSHSKALHKIQSTPVSHIADLRSLISNPDGDEGNRTSDRDASDTLIMVRGKVQTKAFVESNGINQNIDVLIAHNAGDSAVVLEKTQTCLYNEWRGLFWWSSDWRALFGGSLKEQVTTSVRKVPFVLVENYGLQYLNYVNINLDEYVNINLDEYVNINLDESRHPLPLTTVYHQLHPIQASPYTVFQAVFGRGYPVGLLDEEKILPPGKEITAVGCLSLTHDGQPVIKSCKWLPYFLSDLTKDQLVEEIAIGTKVLFWSGIVLSTVAIGVLSYAVLRNWHRWKEWRHRRQAQQPREDPTVVNGMDDDSGEVPDGQLCVVCLMRRRSSAFIPCGHLVCCSRCAQLVERESSPRCPVCRQDVRDSVRIYDS